MARSVIGKWIPVRMAAKILGVSKQRVHELIRNGELTWCKMELTVMVGIESVNRRLAKKEAGRAS